jgi:hypothetical protein
MARIIEIYKRCTDMPVHPAPSVGRRPRSTQRSRAATKTRSASRSRSIASTSCRIGTGRVPADRSGRPRPALRGGRADQQPVGLRGAWRSCSSAITGITLPKWLHPAVSRVVPGQGRSTGEEISSRRSRRCPEEFLRRCPDGLAAARAIDLHSESAAARHGRFRLAATRRGAAAHR